MHSTINQLKIQLISVFLDLFFRKNVEKLHFGFRGGKNIFGFRVLSVSVTSLFNFRRLTCTFVYSIFRRVVLLQKKSNSSIMQATNEQISY